MSRLGANTRSRLGAFVKSSLGARGQLNGFDFRIGWAHNTESFSFDLGVRLNQLLEAQQGIVINSLNIFQTLPHPPKYPKDYPTFNGKAELSVKDEAGNMCLVNGQDKIEIELEHVDGILRSSVDSYTIDYDWQDFRDPAGSYATNPNYDKSANDAKPVAKTYTVTIRLLNVSETELIAKSFTVSFAPLTFAWNLFKSIATVAATADGTFAGRVPVPPDTVAQRAYAGSASGEIYSYWGYHVAVNAISGSIRGLVNAGAYPVVLGQFYTINPNPDSNYYESLMGQAIPFGSWGNHTVETVIAASEIIDSYWVFADENHNTTIVPLQSIYHPFSYHYTTGFGLFQSLPLPPIEVDRHILDEHVSAKLSQTMAAIQLWLPYFASATPSAPINVEIGPTEYVGG